MAMATVPDLLAGDLAAALDAVTFARRLGFDPDPWQADLLRAAPRDTLLNCSRQSGKSTSAALLGYHAARFRPDTLVLILSPSIRQSGELFRKVLDLYHTDHARTTQETQLTMSLANGSRLVSLPGTEKTIRGYSDVDLLIVDEAARVADDLYYAIRPMLAVSGGRIVALSTPYGRRGWFHDVWANGGEAWHRVEVKATDCPRISPAFLDQERRAVPAWWFEQEYMCAFQDSQTSAFSYHDVMAALSEDLETWQL